MFINKVEYALVVYLFFKKIDLNRYLKIASTIQNLFWKHNMVCHCSCESLLLKVPWYKKKIFIEVLFKIITETKIKAGENLIYYLMYVMLC